MQFIKMHGAGNDYIYVDCFRETVPDDLPETARRISDRHFGVGGDGLILIRPSDIADARMQMFNADGSEAEMCGNGIRCVAKYVYEAGIARKPALQIETGNGVLELALEVIGERVGRVRVDLGEPILQADRIPTTLSGDPVVDQPLEVDGQTLMVTCVSMGNPHCVIFVEKATDDMVLGLGPQIEHSAQFPNRVNVEFVEVHGPAEVRQRTWERGSGETLACGTGAGAVCVAGVLTGRTERMILNHLAGGDLELQWGQDNHVYMTGPAEEVFRGQWKTDSSK
ncbi:MAG: diaminopimelate epimerase [Gammaproteobacteria bacterium]|nr:diaminopimelate epimerase [Gammaproteobacteria bacterium]